MFNHHKLAGPAAPLVVEAGEDLVLPCSILPNTSAVDMRVEWFRLGVKNLFVHLYETGADIHEQQDQNYRGRTALFKEELHKGNASLKLSAVQVSDEGAYKCLIREESWHDDITVNVNVVALGTQPVLTMEGYDKSGGINLACESRGWNPQPEVMWLDREGVTLTAEDTETHKDPEGFRMKRRITVHDSNSNRVYCRLQQKHHMRETEIIISSEIFQVRKSAVIGIPVMVVAVVVGFTVAVVLYRKKVDVTLDPDTANPHLILYDDGKKVECGSVEQNLPDNPKRFDWYFSVLGKEGFSSGRFYYEVEVSGKTKWTLGVARESINRKKKILLSPQNGFWTIALRNGTKYEAYTVPSFPLSLTEKLQKVGVFVDYEEGLVSFYDVKARSHIYSFTGQSLTEKLFPFFYTGSIDKDNLAPLIISPVSHE
ncbi:hypothetical protein NFI96_020078 [Prochilodus magdalenae]|nr:hypothetical protein NFI96_020078 [Prochilodus magdalenae]